MSDLFQQNLWNLYIKVWINTVWDTTSDTHVVISNEDFQEIMNLCVAVQESR